ncbi:MAG: CHASE2 domain-containing protein, partial [Cytophagaceae bacterium]
MNLFKSKPALYIACAINSLLMMLVMFVWLNQYLILDDEVMLIRLTTGLNIKLSELGWKEKKQPDPKDFLFIDLTWEKTLADEKNKDGQIIGKRPITDRARIAQLLHSLNKNKDYKFIILDVFFKDSSNYRDDSLLQEEFKQTKNILIPYHKRDEDDLPDQPVFKAPLALSDYEQGNDQFIKYKLVQGNNFKTTPLVMYETLHPEDTLNRNGYLFYKMRDRISMNSFILNLRIWWDDLENSPETASLSEDSIKASADTARFRYSKVYFNDLMVPGLPEEVYSEIIHGRTKDKILIIGAFDEGDMHETIYGTTPGPLILLNAYLAILNKDNQVKWSFMLFL